MRWAAVVITGIAGALIANGCLDDPTFIQAATDGGGIDGAASSTSSSTGGTSTSSSGATSTSSTSSTSGAPPASTCGPSCGFAGGTCEGSTCAFRCPAASPITSLQLACNNQITCPAGTNCLVVCSAKTACKKITCNLPSNDCNITCNGDTACSDQITATAASTEIHCSGNNACKKVDCEGAGKCDVTCDGPACMPPDVKCCSTAECSVNKMATACKK